MHTMCNGRRALFIYSTIQFFNLFVFVMMLIQTAHAWFNFYCTYMESDALLREGPGPAERSHEDWSLGPRDELLEQAQ